MPVATLTPGEPMLFMGEGFRVHATSATTGGRFLIAEIISRPAGGPRHLHSHEAAEQYMCLDGVITVITEDGVHRLAPLESLTIRPWLAHTYRNLGDSPARLLCTLSPPDDMEAFLLAVCEPVSDPGAALPEVTREQSDHAMALAARHGMRIHGEYDPSVLGHGAVPRG
ncbi:MAG: cupin domain-containing protein [Actinobacteria bacterium]|nr:cupin domain-containing protein [Actinomycetota bacterium]